MIFPRAALLGLSVLIMGSTAGAAQPHPHAITFRDIEFDYPKDERLDAAKSQFGAELPVGTPIAQAQAVLHHAGARCRLAKVGDGFVCTFSMQDAPDNHLHDIIWTVRLGQTAGRLTALTFDRASYGS